MNRKITKGMRCRLVEENQIGQVTKATRFHVYGVFDNGKAFIWSRKGFFDDFKILAKETTK